MQKMSAFVVCFVGLEILFYYLLIKDISCCSTINYRLLSMLLEVLDCTHV